MTNSNSKGARRERGLTNELDELGWGVIRIPASGAGTKRELPDVLFGNGTQFYACECKASDRENYIYVEEYEVDALFYFAEKFGAYPLIGVRYDYHDWAFFYPDDLHVTDGGSYRIREQDVEDGERIEDL